MIKSKIETLTEEIVSIRKQLREKEAELKEMKTFFSQAVKYITVGNATRRLGCPRLGECDLLPRQKFGFVVVKNFAFLVWENEAGVRNHGQVSFLNEGIEKCLRSVCLCRPYQEEKIENLTDENINCDGFRIKEIISESVRVAKENGIAMIFARHGNTVKMYEDVRFEDLFDFDDVMPVSSEDLASYAKINLSS